jgi:fructosamine-3-kinase
LTPDLGPIAAAIAAHTGIPFHPHSINPVGGGSIHQSWRVEDDDHRFFVKTGEHASGAMFAAEAQGLRALSEAAVLRAPTFVAQGKTDGGAFLILEFVDMEALDRSGGTLLGAALAELHRIRGPGFGWTEDNFIGATVQRNTPHADWPHFFGECRLRPQLALARQKGMDPKLVAKGLGIADCLGGLFIDYHPLPSLLHGDLWSGNAAQDSNGKPLIFDPACYWGDRETDIAMAELFGGFPESFHVAYRSAWPLDRGYETRKPMYNLYHLLNHFNLFGGAYLGQVERMIERLVAVLRR